MVVFLPLELKLAVMSRDDAGSHENSALVASGDTRKAIRGLGFRVQSR
jgi:hypothetical protein